MFCCAPEKDPEPEPLTKGRDNVHSIRVPQEYTYGRGLPPTEEEYAEREEKHRLEQMMGRHQGGGCIPRKAPPAKPLRPPVPDIQYKGWEPAPEILTITCVSSSPTALRSHSLLAAEARIASAKGAWTTSCAATSASAATRLPAAAAQPLLT